MSDPNSSKNDSGEPDERAATTHHPTDEGHPSEFRIDEHSAERVVQLERKLQHSREQLQAMIEELETSNEKLQATNEELHASNEELQSANEELHSVNEELYTVNAEHQRKIVELADLNNDMSNLLDSTDIATVFLDRELRIRKFTPAILVPFNLLPQDIGRPIDHISHNLELPDLLEKVKAICEGGEPFGREVQTREGLWLLMRILPYKENDRAAAGVVLTFTNIQELKKANERRLRSEQRFRRMFELNVIGVMFTDSSGNVVEANSAFLTMLSYSPDDLPLDRDQIVPIEQREAEQSSRRVAETLGLTTPWESECVRKDGSRVPVLTGSARLEDEDDNESGRSIVSFVLDLTDRKKAEAALADRNELLAQQNEQLDEFSHVASHDLQEPLRALSFFSEALIEDMAGDVPDAAAQDLKYIREAAEQMHVLVEDLLALSRAGRSGMNLQSLSLKDCVDNALRNLSVRLEECNAELEIAELPEVNADPTLMTQLFQNLIANAIKFRRDATPRIQIECEQAGSNWLVSVLDNGIGIEADYLESIFEPFRRLHARSRYKGSGIGLSICRKAVERHGGRIWVESTPGEGSCFKFLLSRQESPASTSQSDSASAINNIREPSND